MNFLRPHLMMFSSLLAYDSSDGETDPEEFANYDMEMDVKAESIKYSPTATLFLPPPKRHREAPVPPTPIEVIPPTIAKTVLESKSQVPEEIEIDIEEMKRESVELAERNAIVRDSTQYNRVGYDRAKSQLTYLAKLDEATRGEFEDQMKRATRARVAAKRMYGW